MPKYSPSERSEMKNIIAILSLKRIPESEIISEVYTRTNKMICPKTLYNLKREIKRDSFTWYKKMREGEYEYIHEFRERISEVFKNQDAPVCFQKPDSAESTIIIGSIGDHLPASGIEYYPFDLQ